MQRFIVPMEKSTRVERGPARERHGGRQPAHLKKISFISEISYSEDIYCKTIILGDSESTMVIFSRSVHHEGNRFVKWSRCSSERQDDDL